MTDARRPRIVVWSPGVPHPSYGASRVLFWHYLAGLRDAGFDVLHLLLVEPANDAPEDLPKYIEDMSLSNTFRVSVHRAPTFVERGRLGARLVEDAVAAARREAVAFEPDVALSLDITSAWAEQGTGGRRVVWLGDLNFETEWHHARYATRERRRESVRMPMAWLRSRAWRRVYREILAGADDVIVAAKSSESVLADLGVAARYLPYPWPAEPQGEHSWRAPDTPTFLFLGTLQALGSRSAFHFLLHDLYPRLRPLFGDFKILVAGHGTPPRWAVEAMATMPELEQIGFVDDLDELFARIHSVLAPIDVPVGNRSRIVTAMGKGALVIAHRNAALGNPDLVHGRTCLLATSADEFADRLRRSVEDRSEATAIIAAARQRYLETFTPEVAVSRLLGAVRSVAASGESGGGSITDTSRRFRA